MAQAPALMDRQQLQACINLEYAQANAQVKVHGGAAAPGFDAIAVYAQHLGALPKAVVAVPDMLKLAEAAGAKLAQTLPKDQTDQSLAQCRSRALPVAVPAKVSPPKSTEALINDKFQAIAITVNDIFASGGVMSLMELTESCYRAVSVRLYDCVIVDLTGKWINDIGPSPDMFAFMGTAAYKKRVAKLVDSGQFRAQDVARLEALVAKKMPDIMMADIDLVDSRAKKNPRPCVVVGADISASYVGECEDHFASGYGIAGGRNLYSGEFKNGFPHGFGRYSHTGKAGTSVEQYHGWYYKGTRTGPAILSLRGTSTNPLLKAIKRYGQLEDGWYRAHVLFGNGQLLRYCDAEEDCRKSVPVFGFGEVQALAQAGARPADLEEVGRLTGLAIARQSGQSAQANACLVHELLTEFFGPRPAPGALDADQLSDYLDFLRNQRRVAQSYLYCTH